MAEDYIDYGRLIDDAMRGIVRKTLKTVQFSGLQNDHHFFITFLTEYPGVMISDKLLAKYPEEMTIIIQHQYWDLDVEETRFSIVLSFDNIQESLTVPFEALTSFADPSVKFGLQFKRPHLQSDKKKSAEKPAKAGRASKAKKKDAKAKDEVTGDNSNVVSIDTFRKK